LLINDIVHIDLIQFPGCHIVISDFAFLSSVPAENEMARCSS